MQKIKILWIALTVGVAAVCAYFGGRTALGFYQYWKLGQSTSAKIKEWKVLPEKSGKYSIQATYEYFVKERPYQGITKFSAPVFLNSESAVRELQDWSQQKWLVWYDPSETSFSSLEKHFPINLFFRFFLSLGVFLYFLWVKLRILKSISL